MDDVILGVPTERQMTEPSFSTELIFGLTGLWRSKVLYVKILRLVVSSRSIYI